MTADQIPEVSRQHMQHLVNLMAPARLYHRPRFFHARRLHHKRPTMVVVNHNIMGMEVPFLITEPFRRRKIILRPLSERFAFHNPVYRAFVGIAGFVEGNREICSALMQRGEFPVVAPGGAREVARRRGESYELQWGDRLGFVRLAVEHGYSLTPMAIVGTEEAVDIVLDPDEIMASPIGDFLRRSGLYTRVLQDGKYVFPMFRGVGATPLPRPERVDFSVGEPFETAQLGGKATEEQLRALRETVKAELQRQLDFLRAKRA